MNEYGYFAKTVAQDLDITTSTLRRWSIALENAGYKIERNDKEQRVYHERDFKAFREIKGLLGNNVKMEDAINAVIANFKQYENASQTPSVHEINERLLEREFVDLLDDRIEKAVKKAFDEGRNQGREEMKEVLNRIDERLEARDQTLMKTLDEMMETRRLLAAAKDKKQNFWKRLLKKS